MPKRFDCENEPNEFMDAPCMCDCGKWFDLSDGYRVGDKIVCKGCLDNANESDEDDEGDASDEGELDIEEEDTWASGLKKIGIPMNKPLYDGWI